MDHLEDLVGKDEALRIGNSAEENSPQLRKSQSTEKQLASEAPEINGDVDHQPAAEDLDSSPRREACPIPPTSNSVATPVYSMWTSRSLVTFPTAVPSRQESCPPGGDGDEMIPFSDVPCVSRFGPISRHQGRQPTLMQFAPPSQTQAALSDDTTLTAVVRHSKQMVRQMPSVAAALYHNGGCTALHPVGPGPHGEIGYLAVPPGDPLPPPPDPALQQIQTNSAMHQLGPVASSQQQQQQHLYAESQRMKQELEQLQRKIDRLNMAHIDQNQIGGGSNGAPLGGPCPEPVASSHEKEQLANELAMIECTIRDREREISVNHHVQMGQQEACPGEEASASPDPPDPPTGQHITTTAFSGLKAISPITTAVE